MNNINSEHEWLNEFAEFVETDTVSPSKNREDAIVNMVTRDLCPAPLKVFSKFTLIEVASGLLTLTICPQFGLGAGRHNEFLHSLHTMTTPIVFYLFCGLFFVLLGAGLSGLILSRAEIRTIGNIKFCLFRSL